MLTVGAAAAMFYNIIGATGLTVLLKDTVTVIVEVWVTDNLSRYSDWATITHLSQS